MSKFLLLNNLRSRPNIIPRTRILLLLVAGTLLCAGGNAALGQERIALEPRTVDALMRESRDEGSVPPPQDLVVVRAELVDNGDGDGWADTNETVAMRLVVYNPLGIDVTNLVAELSTLDPRIVCISNARAIIGDIASQQLKIGETAFEFMVEDVERSAVGESFAAEFTIRMSADQSDVQDNPHVITLELDLDASGGSGPTTYLESFESGFGSFTTMHIDEALNPPDSDLGNNEAGLLNSDGFRCQYSDPDWEGSEPFGTYQATVCYPNPDGRPDAFYFDVSDDRAFSGNRSMHFGVFLDPVLGFTTPTSQLEAIVTSQPMSLGWHDVCSVSRTQACAGDIDCPTGETCEPATPELLFKQQVSFIDHRMLNTGGPTSLDRGVVQAQLVDDSSASAGNWVKLAPYINGYDTEASSRFINCYFDPIDDGNSEEDFFDPSDPYRRLGPSTTCQPEFNFAHLGETALPFDAGSIGDASDGPGLDGSSGLGTWIESRIDLSRFRGRRIRLRFLVSQMRIGFVATHEEIFHKNPTALDDGWFIDDVTVTDALVEPATTSVDTRDNLDIKQDFDADGYGAVCDCAPADESAWALPGPAGNLKLSHAGGVAGTTTLSWTAPDELGGIAVDYDTVGSTNPSDFATFGFCVESSDGSDTISIDSTTPSSGTFHSFLIRAKHICGPSSLGTSSSGVPRTAISCL